MSRLIDADALLEKIYKYSDNEGAKMPYGDDDSLIHRDSVCFLIEKAPTINPESHWIPVTKRLPKKSGVYTVTDHKGDVVRFVFNIGSDSSRRYWYRCAKAWMPLPESWKGE